MFEIEQISTDEVRLKGHFDASQVATALPIFDALDASSTVHFDELEYISSAGLGVLLATQQRLAEVGGALRLTGLNPHVRLVFEYAGFDQIFEID